MLAVAHYLPDNAAEAELAVQLVAADFHAKDAMLSATAADDDPEKKRQCRAQVASMMRGMQAGIRTLQKMQAIREKAEAERYPPAMERAGYWFKDVSVPAPHHRSPPPPRRSGPSSRWTRPSSTPTSIPTAPLRSAPTAACRRTPPGDRPTMTQPAPSSSATAPSFARWILRHLTHATSGPGKTLRDADEMPSAAHGEDQDWAGHAPDRVTSRATARMVW